MGARLSTAEVAGLDPYQLMATVGKRVIHPGGGRSTGEIFTRANLVPGDTVLEVGCGVGTTAIEVARRFGATVTAVDIDEAMVDRAAESVRAAGTEKVVDVRLADIQALPFPDEAFDCVIIEAVTMFVDRERAAREALRVCKKGGQLFDHEFVWRRPPTAEARRIFTQELCPGIDFDTAEDWARLYEDAGLDSVEAVSGPFAMMSPLGFLRDEGALNSSRIVLTTLTRPAYAAAMARMMRRMKPSAPYLGSIVIAGEKPAASE